MNNLKFSVFIKAPREKVWKTMLEDVTYRQWTKEFDPTSYYEGDWSEGSKMLFLSKDENGNVRGGMSSVIAKNIPNEYISIKHLGMIMDGVETPWEGPGDGYENYIFTDKDGGTFVEAELTNLPGTYIDMMNDMWPKALEALRVLAEK